MIQPKITITKPNICLTISKRDYGRHSLEVELPALSGKGIYRAVRTLEAPCAAL